MPFLKINSKSIIVNRNFSIHHSPFTIHFEVKRAFTLIEFLVVLGILALVVGSITLFLTSVLKGTNQANVLSEVKQNGQATLDSLERQIRGAVDAEAVDSNHLKIIREEAQPLHIKCLVR